MNEPEEAKQVFTTAKAKMNGSGVVLGPDGKIKYQVPVELAPEPKKETD